MTIGGFLILVGLTIALGASYVLLARSKMVQKKEHSRLRSSWTFKGLLYVVFGILAFAGLLIWILIQLFV